MTAPAGPGEKSRNRSSWPRIAATFASSVSRSSRFRSDERPDGSPIIPVPPPTSATGRPPWRWSRSSPKIGTRWPTWSERAGRVEPDVAGDRPAGRQARRQPGRRRVQDARATRARRAARPAAAGRGAPVTGRARRVVSTIREAGQTVRSRPLCYRAATDADQPRAAPAPSTGARSADREDAAGPTVGQVARRHPRRPVRRPSACSPAAGARRRRGRVQLLRRRACPTPSQRSTNIDFEQQTIVYDRTGKIELARLGDLKRELVTFDQTARRDHRRDDRRSRTRTSGPTRASTRSASSRPAIDTLQGRPRGASTITQQLVRARLLPPSAFEGTTYERKIKRDHPVDPPDPGVPGRGRASRQIITAYLNQNFYGNQSYGVKAAAKSYFGKSLDDLTLAQAAILAAIPQSPTKFDLVRNAERGLPRSTSPRARSAPNFKLVVPAGLRDRPAPQPDPRPDEDAQRADRRQAHRRRLRGGQGRAGRARRQQVSADWQAPHFVWQVRHELGQILLPGRRPTTAREVDTGGYKVITTLDWDDAAGRREVGLRRGSRAATPRTRRRSSRSRKIPKRRRGLDPRPARPQHPQRRGRASIDYRTGEILAYVGQRQLHVARATRSSSPSSTSSPTAGASPGRRSSRSTTRSASTTRP